MRRDRVDGAAGHRPGRCGRHPADHPRAIARGALRGALRRRRPPMTALAVAADRALPAGPRDRWRTDVMVATRSFRQVWLGATACAVTFGLTAASSALTYVTSFPTDAA